jgi:hypothetical protein
MIPDVDFLKSSTMVHKFADFFNPPGLTNFLGVVHTEIDLTAISSLSFPPFSCADHRTAGFFIDERYFPSSGQPISFVWYPDRVERSADHNGLHLKSTTFLPVEKMAVIIEIKIDNTSGSKRTIPIRIGLNGGITNEKKAWNIALPPSEEDNELLIDDDRKAVIFSARKSAAYMIQGSHPKPERIVAAGLEYNLTLNPGESKTVHYINAVGENHKDVNNLFDSLTRSVKEEKQKVRDYWNAELKAIFTPGNTRYSGSLPVLETKDEDILRMYFISILSVVYFKRDNPNSIYGRAYDTLMPKYWQTVTFIWDYALSSFIHALLDPQVMKKYLEQWMLLDIYNHFGTDYLTGSAVGNWYAANDFNMMVILNDYLCWTGNFDWLKNEISDRTSGSKTKSVLDYIFQYATSWKRFKSASGLADYGEINNLLECVSTYIHEVASLNAANVFNMRTAGKILSIAGDDEKSNSLINQSSDLVEEVQKLYAKGKGYWNTRFPDGSLVDVRHCYDFFTILNTIAADLSGKQKDEMVQFFQQEFQTKLWMRALAPSDSNAMFSVRPDHQWDGAYPAWPSHSLKALYKIGKTDLAFKWLKGLAKSFNQGPLCQAHFVEDVVEPEDGGARKASFEYPYLTDWACSGGGSWVSVIIESIFGVRAELGGGISASPNFSDFDPTAELHDLVYQGKKYHVTKDGLKSG